MKPPNTVEDAMVLLVLWYTEPFTYEIFSYVDQSQFHSV